MGNISKNIEQSQLRRRFLKAVSEKGLHYFLCCINETAAVKLAKTTLKLQTTYLSNTVLYITLPRTY